MKLFLSEKKFTSYEASMSAASAIQIQIYYVIYI